MDRVAVLCLPQVDVFDLGVALETFTWARDGDSEPLYEIEICAPEPGRIKTFQGIGYLLDVEPPTEPVAVVEPAGAASAAEEPKP